MADAPACLLIDAEPMAPACIERLADFRILANQPCMVCDQWLRVAIREALRHAPPSCRRPGDACVGLWLRRKPPAWEHFCANCEGWAWTAVQLRYPRSLGGSV